MHFKKVYSITPNPALDLGGEVKEIIANEKNYVLKETRFPGGNAINAARILNRLGCPVQAGGFLGGAVGHKIDRLLREEDIRTDFVAIKDETRINITVSNRASHKQTRFSFLGPKISRSENQQLLKKLKNKQSDTLFMLGGSFPSQFKISDAKRILEFGHRNKIATIVDVPDPYLRALLPSKPLMNKPNLLEFEQLIGKKLHRIPDIIAEAKKFLKFCPVICVSSVNKGVLLITEGACYFAKGPRVVAKSSVGAGDSWWEL